jgi:hypothetical protein
MNYAAMISQSAKGFGVQQLITIHVVEPGGDRQFHWVNQTHRVMYTEMLDLLEALGVLICSGLNGRQRGCEGGRWVGGLRYTQACDCAWIFWRQGLCIEKNQTHQLTGRR